MADPEAEPQTPDRRLLIVVLLGLLVVFLPLFLVPTSGDAGPVGFAVRLMQAIAATVGVVVAAAGLYSYRTGDPRPGVAAAATVLGLVGVGLVGAAVELSGGRLVPPWVWFLAAVAVILAAFGLTLRYVGPDET